MAVEFERIRRIFRYNALEIPDPDPNMSVDKIKRLLANQYPELNNAAVEGPERVGGDHVFTLKRSIGTKG
jgi:PRTRC genetic system protein C